MFQKGNKLSAGRPKAGRTLAREKASEYITKRVIKELAPIMDKAIAQAKDGDVQTRKDLMDRALGKAKESIDIKEEVTLRIDV